MREIIDKLDFIKIKTFSSSKHIVDKNEKTNHRMGENTCKRHI